MDQDLEAEAPADSAAIAFDALRREVALLKVAIGGLALERAATPDYSETLGEITKGVSVAVGRLGKVLTSPALTMTATEMARQISMAGDEARRQDRALIRLALDDMKLAAADLRRWITAARLAKLQNRCLLQTAAAGALVGALLGAWLPGPIARVAPERWAWPERLAARTLDRDPWSAGERMLEVADPARWRGLRLQSATANALHTDGAPNSPPSKSKRKGAAPINRHSGPSDAR